MSPENKNPEVKKPSVESSVESLIARKKAERAEEGAREVQRGAEATQGEVAEVMAGVDKPKEKVSEKKGESGEKGDLKTGMGKAQKDEGSVTLSPMAAYRFLSEEIMVKKVRSAISAQIRTELKRAHKLAKNLESGSAQEYNASIARIRTLKEVLQSLLTATFEAIKNLYVKYFMPDGHRKSADEID